MAQRDDRGGEGAEGQWDDPGCAEAPGPEVEVMSAGSDSPAGPLAPPVILQRPCQGLSPSLRRPTLGAA